MYMYECSRNVHIILKIKKYSMSCNSVRKFQDHGYEIWKYHVLGINKCYLKTKQTE